MEKPPSFNSQECEGMRSRVLTFEASGINHEGSAKKQYTCFGSNAITVAKTQRQKSISSTWIQNYSRNNRRGGSLWLFILFLKPQYWYVSKFFEEADLQRVDDSFWLFYRLPLNLTQNSVERIGLKIIWQIRPILVTIWLYFSTDSILGGLSFRNLEN